MWGWGRGERDPALCQQLYIQGWRLSYRTHTLLLLISFRPLGPSPRPVNVNFSSKILHLGHYTVPKFLATFWGLQRSRVFDYYTTTPITVLTCDFSNEHFLCSQVQESSKIQDRSGKRRWANCLTYAELTLFLHCFPTLLFWATQPFLWSLTNTNLWF